MGCSDDDMGKFYQKWNQGELAGYLVEITGRIFSQAGRENRPPSD
jgi:6-phosphogluconate dehydrogenase